jgi:predicted RNA-binding Zn-ribbon protein involved in translation (DUF1610 family)
MNITTEELIRIRNAGFVDSERMVHELIEEIIESRKVPLEAIPMLLWCPDCGARHIDIGEFAKKLHHTHACQSCGMVWRPAISHTVGVQWLPGFKNATGAEL